MKIAMEGSKNETRNDNSTIAVINVGELVELGTHEELMNIETGQHKAFYEMQLKKQEIST